MTPTAEELTERANAESWIEMYNLEIIYETMKALPTPDRFGTRTVVEVWHPDGYTIGWVFVHLDTMEWAFVFAKNSEQPNAE